VKVSDLSVDGGDGVGVEPGALGPVGGGVGLRPERRPCATTI
jgi:hypothetical protein